MRTTGVVQRARGQAYVPRRSARSVAWPAPSARQGRDLRPVVAWHGVVQQSVDALMRFDRREELEVQVRFSSSDHWGVIGESSLWRRSPGLFSIGFSDAVRHHETKLARGARSAAGIWIRKAMLSTPWPARGRLRPSLAAVGSATPGRFSSLTRRIDVRDADLRASARRRKRRITAAPTEGTCRPMQRRRAAAQVSCWTAPVGPHSVSSLGRPWSAPGAPSGRSRSPSGRPPAATR